MRGLRTGNGTKLYFTNKFYSAIAMHIAVVIVILSLGSLPICISNTQNIARFDNYRLYHITFESEQQVKIFQELEQKSDSCTFYGHARAPGQKLTIMVAAHKIADFADLLERFNVEHEVLVSINNRKSYNLYCKFHNSL